MRRLLLSLSIFSVVLGGCSNDLGRSAPVCGDERTASGILQIQAIDGAAFVPCIESLPVGWEFNHLRAGSGYSEFTLDSDRMGDAFLQVRTSTRCDIGGTREATGPRPGIRLFVDVEADRSVPMVFVPEGPTDATIDAAQAIVTGLVGELIDGKRIDVTIDRSDSPAAERIETARANGANVFVIGLREAEEGTVTVSLAGQTAEATVPVATAIRMVERAERPPSYRGSWFYLFDGGCIEYRFDASGSETHDLEQRVETTLGFTDAEAVREMARSLGYDI